MRIKDGYVLRRVGKIGIVVGNAEEDYIATLNQTGVDLWEMLGEETQPSKLVQQMMAKYEVSREILEKDVRDFLRKIKKIGLLEE